MMKDILLIGCLLVLYGNCFVLDESNYLYINTSMSRGNVVLSMCFNFN